MKNSKSVSAVMKTVGMYENDRQKQIKELQRLIKKGQKSGNAVMIGAAYYHIAYACYALDDMDGLFTNALKAVALLEETKEYELTAKAYVALNYAYNFQENNQMAFAECDKAYQIEKRHRIKGNVRIITLNNLAVCYHNMGNCEESIRILKECLEQVGRESPGDFSNMAMFSINLANYYKDDGKLETAKELLDSMESWIEKADYKPFVCDYYLNRAIIYSKLGDVSGSCEYVDAALERIPANTCPLPLYDDFREVAHILISRGDSARAKRIFDLIADYAEKNKSTREQLIAYRMMADYYGGEGDAARALECYRQLDALYEKRMKELTGMKLTVYQRMKDAEAEIKKLKRKMKESEALVSLEPMTKLLNRSGLLALSAKFIEEAAKKKQKIGAIFIDIDLFKECNDTYGHTVGDRIIQTVARACRAEESENVRFARYGGDEFFGITIGLEDGDVTEIARKICRYVRAANIPHKKNPNGHRITLSVGVVNVPITDQTDTIIEIANYADKAAYYAKSAGKDSIYLLDHDKGENRTEFVRIEFEN